MKDNRTVKLIFAFLLATVFLFSAIEGRFGSIIGSIIDTQDMQMIGS